MSKLRMRGAAKVEKRYETAVGLTHSHGFANPLRFEIGDAQYTVTALTLTVAAVELHLCEEASWLVAPSWLVPEASAHVADTPLRLGTVAVEDLLSKPGAAKMIGELAPIPGKYCRAAVVLAPADDDATNLSKLPTADVLGTTLVVAGEVRTAGGTAPFRWSSSNRHVVSIDLPAGLSEPPIQLLIDKNVDSALWADITASDVENGRAADLTLVRLVRRIRRYKR